MALSDRRSGGLGQADIKHSSTDGDLGEDQIRKRKVKEAEMLFQTQIRKRKVKEAEMLFQTQIRAQLADMNEEMRMKKMEMACRYPRYPGYLQCGYEQYPGWWGYKMCVERSYMEISHLRSALYVLYGSRKLIPHSEKANSLPTLLEEIDDQIAKLQFRMQHGCKSIKGEKQLIREIKEAKLAKQRALADSLAKADMRRYLGSKGAIEDRIQGIVTRMKEWKKEDMESRTKVKNSQRHMERLGDEIRRLERKLAATNKKKMEIYERINC